MLTVLFSAIPNLILFSSIKASYPLPPTLSLVLRSHLHTWPLKFFFAIDVDSNDFVVFLLSNAVFDKLACVCPKPVWMNGLNRVIRVSPVIALFVFIVYAAVKLYTACQNDRGLTIPPPSLGDFLSHLFIFTEVNSFT